MVMCGYKSKCLEDHLVEVTWNNSSVFPCGACDLSRHRFLPWFTALNTFFRLGLKSVGNQLVVSLTSVSLLHQQIHFIRHVDSVVCQVCKPIRLFMKVLHQYIPYFSGNTKASQLRVFFQFWPYWSFPYSFVHILHPHHVAWPWARHRSLDRVGGICLCCLPQLMSRRKQIHGMSAMFVAREQCSSSHRLWADKVATASLHLPYAAA